MAHEQWRLQCSPHGEMCFVLDLSINLGFSRILLQIIGTLLPRHLSFLHFPLRAYQDRSSLLAVHDLRMRRLGSLCSKRSSEYLRTVSTLEEYMKECASRPGAMQCGSFASSQLQSASGLVNASYMSPDIRHEFARDIPHCFSRQLHDPGPVLPHIASIRVIKTARLTVWT